MHLQPILHAMHDAQHSGDCQQLYNTIFLCLSRTKRAKCNKSMGVAEGTETGRMQGGRGCAHLGGSMRYAVWPIATVR